MDTHTPWTRIPTPRKQAVPNKASSITPDQKRSTKLVSTFVGASIHARAFSTRWVSTFIASTFIGSPDRKVGVHDRVHEEYVRTFHSWISSDVAGSATRLQQGDLLFAGSGETKADIGKCVAYVHDFEAYAGGDIVILRPRGVDPLYFGFVLNTEPANQQKASLGQGDAVVHISATALAQVTVSVPPINEQVAIATVFRDIDSEIAALRRCRDKTRAIKQGMMQQLLTGRVRLVQPTMSTPEVATP